jgi:hypothetical protein
MDSYGLWRAAKERQVVEPWNVLTSMMPRFRVWFQTQVFSSLAESESHVVQYPKIPKEIYYEHTTRVMKSIITRITAAGPYHISY